MTAITASNHMFQFNFELTIKARTVYVYLAHRSNRQNTCFPGLRRIAQECGISISSVQRAIRELLEFGLVKKEVRHRENRSQTSNLYILANDHNEISNFKKQNTVSKKIREERKREEQLVLEEVDKVSNALEKAEVTSPGSAEGGKKEAGMKQHSEDFKQSKSKRNKVHSIFKAVTQTFKFQKLTRGGGQFDMPKNLERLTLLLTEKEKILLILKKYLKQ